MIKLHVYTPNSSELSHSSQHNTLDDLHACLWRLLEHLKDDWVFCISRDVGLEHRLMRDAQGIWRFTDGTQLKGPVLRTYWRVNDGRTFNRYTDRKIAIEEFKFTSGLGMPAKITRVTVRAKARREDGTR